MTKLSWTDAPDETASYHAGTDVQCSIATTRINLGDNTAGEYILGKGWFDDVWSVELAAYDRTNGRLGTAFHAQADSMDAAKAAAQAYEDTHATAEVPG